MIKLDIDYIKSEFEKEGYKLLTRRYLNNSQKLEYICPSGHKHSISWNKWCVGRRCPFCRMRKVGSNIRLGLDYIITEFAKEGLRVLSDEYVDAHTPIKCECEYGHGFYLTWANFKHNNRRCSVCGIISRSGENHYAFNNWSSIGPYCQIWADKEYKESIKERDGYKCLNPCCNSNNPNDLNIHHIDYNKKNCAPNNLITLCRSCNSKANHNRDWHVSWYKYTLLRRYGYCE